MNTKHTPGPWGIEQTETNNWIGPMRRDGIKVNEIVCDTEREGLKDEVVEKNDANAKLIAAAPELLEALAFYVQICGNTGYSITRESAREMHDQGSAALEKALGKL